MRQLPPLNAVRTFEAAARHLSFNNAAEELHITPSAVSHQVRTLEEHLGVKLFRRLNRQVELTAEGTGYLPPLRAALDQIDAATARVISNRESGPLVISVAPAYATRWLVPRLPGFQEVHPGIEVRPIISVEISDFDRSDTDLAVRHGRGVWPGLASHLLMKEEVLPVCSPDLLAAGPPLAMPKDLAQHTLLHIMPRMGEWRSWLSLAGVEGVDAERGPRFQNGPMAVDAAISGLGVAIANLRLVEADLAAGRLVVPFDIELPVDGGYYLVYPEERADAPKIKAFREWLLAEAAVSDAEIE